MTYRQVKSVPGLEVTADAEFLYKGKPKKVIYCHTVNGRKATARIMIMWGGKSHYWQAAKLVAEAWKRGYEEGNRITYKDGNCHNIKADNCRKHIMNRTDPRTPSIAIITWYECDHYDAIDPEKYKDKKNGKHT